MTEENRKANIAEEDGRVSGALAEADLLAAHGYLAGAVSRLYYALLYAVRALLLTEGIETRSHEGALRMLGLHFVKPGTFGPGVAHLFSKLMKFREEADYNPSYVFTPEDFSGLRKDAAEAIAGIRRHLAAGGHRPPDATGTS